MVQCVRRGCHGSCPAFVVIRGHKSDGIPPKCQVCDQVYKKPNASVIAMVENSRTARPSTRPPRSPSAANDEAAKKIERMEKRCKELEAKLHSLDKDKDDTPSEDIEVNDENKERVARIREIQGQIRDLRRIPAATRLKLPKLDQEITQLVDEKNALDKAQRESKPLETRLAKVQQHEKYAQTKADAVHKEVDNLLKQKELDKKLREKQAEATKADEALAQAKEEHSQLLLQQAKEKGHNFESPDKTPPPAAAPFAAYAPQLLAWLLTKVDQQAIQAECAQQGWEIAAFEAATAGVVGAVAQAVEGQVQGQVREGQAAQLPEETAARAPPAPPAPNDDAEMEEFDDEEAEEVFDDGFWEEVAAKDAGARKAAIQQKLKEDRRRTSAKAKAKVRKLGIGK
jgi:myosin heavy subunit